MMKIKSFSLLTFFTSVFLMSQSTRAADFKWENDLAEAIKSEGLDQLIPKELANCDGSGDNVKMWTEFMKGLSYIESSWDEKKNNPNDANGTPSKGLFQMTGGDMALGQNCFGTKDPKSDAPFDAKKNIQCAVKKMKELVSGQGGSGKSKSSAASSGSFGAGGSSRMSGSLYEQASKYWGPLKKGSVAHTKVEFLVSDIAGNCGSKAFEPSVLGHGGSTQGQASRGGYKGRN